ncbi:hypothetical protein B9Y75_06580 [Stenotrophomonas maltophilia]|nr:hypothetical protein B9Y75_06580 [Stenotrophomonas maltophilia]
MTTKYPSELDQFENPRPNDSQAKTRTHSDQHGDANDAIEAVQKKVGVNDSSDPESLDFQVGALQNLTESLGSAAFRPVSSFASAAQGARADSSVQPAQLANATQLLQEEIDATEGQLQGQIDALEAGQSTSAIYANTLADLQAVTGTYVGQGAFVLNGTGAGQYRWDGSSWQFLRADSLASKADLAELNYRIEKGIRVTSSFDTDYAWKLQDDTLRHAGGWLWDGTFNPVKMRIPDQTVIGSDSLSDRLVPTEVKFRVESDSVYAWKLSGQNRRHAGGWRWDGTFAPIKAELPATATIADDPTRTIIQRIGTTALAWVLSEFGGKVYADDLKQGRRYVVAQGSAALLMGTDYASWAASDGRRFGRTLPDGLIQPLTPKRQIVMWGDSITAAQGNGMSSLVEMPVINRGEPGWASRDVSIKQGAQPVVLGAAGGQIPATGSVAVAVSDPTTGLTPYVDTSWVGELAGVRGTLSRSYASNTWSFTRASAGAVVACPPGSVFRATEDAQYLDSIAIIGVGRNDVYLPDFAPAVLDSIAKMVNYLTPKVRQVVVVSITNMQTEGPGNAKYDQIIAVNEQMAQIYGDRYFDLRRQFIVQGLGMALANGWISQITTADQIAVADDRPPPSLMSDNTHRNAAGVLVDQHLHAANLTTKGYVL